MGFLELAMTSSMMEANRMFASAGRFLVCFVMPKNIPGQTMDFKARIQGSPLPESLARIPTKTRSWKDLELPSKTCANLRNWVKGRARSASSLQKAVSPL